MFTETQWKLQKDFELLNYQEALDFVNKVWEISEEQDHHPDILLHGYKKVRVTTITHSEGKITQKDYDIAQKIEKIYNTNN